MSYQASIEFPPLNVLPELYTVVTTPRQKEVLDAVIAAEGSPTEAERWLTANHKPRLNDSGIGKMMRKLYFLYRQIDPTDEAPRILIIDIETAPTNAWVWRMFKENIGQNQVIDHSYLMCYAAKWLGSDTVVYEEQRGKNDAELMKNIIALFNEADLVVAHNGDRFDIPRINTAAIKLGLKPPMPYRSVDTLKVAKKHFKFTRNTLANLAEELDCAPKETHAAFPGFELWSACMDGNPEAWVEMKTYNIQDVLTLEQVYLKLRPWHKEHPNLAVFYEDGDLHCSKCGGTNLVGVKPFHTDVSKFPVYRCTECGGFSRDRRNHYPKEIRQDLITTVRS